MRNIDITGQKFGRLTAIRKAFIKNKSQYWECLCECGNKKIVKKSHLINLKIRSCGCLVHENNGGYKHGFSKTRIYSIFRGMKNRCYNPNEPAYIRYGGKGIKICNDWLKNPKEFINWAYNNGYSDTLTIERIDNSKGYEPSNCRWIPIEEQQRNTSLNFVIEYQGRKQCLASWCQELGLNPERTRQRIRRDNWSIERAFNTKEPLTNWKRR